MRNFGPRPVIPLLCTARLSAKTAEIMGQPAGFGRQTRARAIYDSSRGAVWFVPVIDALRSLSGVGEFCMYCSANEPSQVEHFKPLTSFPETAMAYENFLWACDICNRTHKGDKFPPATGPGAPIINPIDENPWDFFYLDSTFGRLMKRYANLPSGLDARAETTCEICGIDRENVQIRRQHRFKALSSDVSRTVTDLGDGRITVEEARLHVQSLLEVASQPDVADYFLLGPGRADPPFNELHDLIA